MRNSSKLSSFEPVRVFERIKSCEVIEIRHESQNSRALNVNVCKDNLDKNSKYL